MSCQLRNVAKVLPVCNVLREPSLVGCAGTSNRRREFAYRLALLVIPIFGTILLIEFTLRAVGYFPERGWYPSGMFSSDGELGYVPSPNFRGTLHRREYVTEVMHNDLGLPGLPLPEPKSSVPVVAIVGDSFIHGYFVNPGETLPARLQGIFGSKNQVVNMGVGGYSTFQ